MKNPYEAVLSLLRSDCGIRCGLIQLSHALTFLPDPISCHQHSGEKHNLFSSHDYVLLTHNTELIVLFSLLKTLMFPQHLQGAL